MTKRILVFPCGSEVGLEIYRSMRYSSHFDLVGASSVDDHGRFVFEQYIGGVPFHTHPLFAKFIDRLVRDYQIDAIYPAMDAVADTIMQLKSELGVRIIGSSAETTKICLSKAATYGKLKDVVPIPALYKKPSEVSIYPVFIKPDKGYGARNTFLAHNSAAVHSYLSRFDEGSMLLLEYLPGKEWTIDCFSDRHGKLCFHAPRVRGRISNGVSVYTKPSDEFTDKFVQWAHIINQKLKPRGAWFFQAKLDVHGYPKLLEVAARIGGSSGLFRCRGVNFALLSAFDAFDIDVSVKSNDYLIEMDRALNSCYKISLYYKHIYVDLDDCLIVRNQINLQLLNFLYKAILEGKKITLVTRHYRDPMITLKENRISEIFDDIIHVVNKKEMKSIYIAEPESIFIDDSYSERDDVAKKHKIPVFSPDMIEALI